MNKNSITSKTYERIKAIHLLSQEYNKKAGVAHQEKLLDLMKHHIVEIGELLEKKDEHALVETGDLLILCFELLIEHNKSIDDVIEICMGRYERKLSSLNKER